MHRPQRWRDALARWILRTLQPALQALQEPPPPLPPPPTAGWYKFPTAATHFFSALREHVGPAGRRLLVDQTQMSSSSETAPTNTTPENVPGTGEPPKKKRREASNKPRPPARPYRRIEPDVLESRIRDLNKRLAVLRSKVVLLEDRLESHNNEDEMRKTEVASASLG